MDKMCKVVSIIRTDGKNELLNVCNQYKDIDAAIFTQGLDDVKSFELVGVERTDICFDKRFPKIIQMLKEGHITGIAVSNVNCIIWNPSCRTVDVLKEFLNLNFKIFMPDQIIDSKDLALSLSDWVPLIDTGSENQF